MTPYQCSGVQVPQGIPHSATAICAQHMHRHAYGPCAFALLPGPEMNHIIEIVLWKAGPELLDVFPDLLNKVAGIDKYFLNATSIQRLEYVVQNRNIDEWNERLEGIK